MKTTLSPYLIFNGNCREAMAFYHSVIGGELMMQSFGEAGVNRSEEAKDRIIHASLQNGDVHIMGSDSEEDPEKAAVFGNNVHLSITGTDDEKLREYFVRLSEDGMVNMPLARQFWGDIFGMLTDRFGIHWMINISSPAP